MDGFSGGNNRQRNVLGGWLIPCSTAPMTGFYRNGCCDTGDEDMGLHTVCAVMTDAFLDFSRAVGNDLSTPRPEYGFPGLKAGDQWCLCASRWEQARQAGSAPYVVLAATNMASLNICDIDHLKSLAIDGDNSNNTNRA
ncbi:MAG: DUF2237 family protein [Candidatus Puniceispirillales bacterium]